MHQRHALIVIVSHDRKPDFETMSMLHRSTPTLMQMGWRSTHAVHAGDADLAGARNFVLAAFLAQKQFSDLVFVDNDVSCDPGGVERLLSHPVDLVYGAYPKRSEPEAYAVSALPGGRPFVDPRTKQSAPDGLIETAGGPTGFMRITRHCAETMSAAYANRWYRDDRLPDVDVVNLFEFAVIDNERYTEDLHFCKLWTEVGGIAWCDPHIVMHHHGTKTYSGQFAEFIRRGGKSIADKA